MSHASGSDGQQEVEKIPSKAMPAELQAQRAAAASMGDLVALKAVLATFSISTFGRRMFGS